MLLLMMQAEHDELGGAPGQRLRQQLGHGGIDMGTVPSDLRHPRARQQSSLGAGMTGADGLVVGVEQEREVRVEGGYPWACSSSTKVSKNHVVWARCHLVGLTSFIDWTVWSSGLRGVARCSVRERTDA